MRGACFRANVAADRAVAVDIVVAAAEGAGRNGAGTFEHDIGCVDDEEDLAPAFEFLHHVGEKFAFDERAMCRRQCLDDGQRADAIFAGDPLDDAVGILCEPLPQRLERGVGNGLADRLAHRSFSFSSAGVLVRRVVVYSAACMTLLPSALTS